MNALLQLAGEIAELWRCECGFENQALLQSDPILRSSIRADAEELAKTRMQLHEKIAREPAGDLKEALILSLFAADYLARNDAGSSNRDTPARHLHNSIINALETASGISRTELGLEFLWISDFDGPGSDAGEA